MDEHGARDGLGGGEHAGDIYGEDGGAGLCGVGQGGGFVLDPGGGDEAVEAGVLRGDGGDEGV